MIQKPVFLEKEDIYDILRLQRLVVDSLPEKELFMPHRESYFKNILCFDKAAAGVMVGDDLVAYSIISVPGKSQDNLGRDILLPEEELSQVAHIQAIAVHPSHRGAGIQGKLAEFHLRVIKDMGFRYVLCTISPKNPWSLLNMLSAGFAIYGLKLKFDGWWRYIMLKDNFLQRTECTFAHHNSIQIDSLDIIGQKDLLDRGFRGVEAERKENRCTVIFMKP